MVVCGEQGDDEYATEASVMTKYLIDKELIQSEFIKNKNQSA